MLTNIFLFKGKNFNELENLNIYAYPKDIIKIENKDLINKIIYGHDHADLIQNYRNSKKKANLKPPLSNKTKKVLIDTPVPQIIDELNIYTSCINGKFIVGLIFEQEDNPYDYRDVFEEVLHELLTNGEGYSFDDEIDVENFLITIFIDIRRHGDEFVRKIPQVMLELEKDVVKVFLFGIDEVGKSSLVRRIKTGDFNDNHFMPTKKFNIEYIQREHGLLTWWDMPGQVSFRNKWIRGMQDSNIIVYMIDVSNQLRFEESKREIWKILNRYEIDGIPLLILGNKVDLINLGNDADQTQRMKNEILSFFDLEKIKERNWEFLFTSVKTNYQVDAVISVIYDLLHSNLF